MNNFERRAAKQAKLSHERLLRELAYNRDTGLFWWRRAAPGRRLQTPAGTLRPDGYVQAWIDGTPYLAHRLAWFYVHGSWPEDEIDHENRNRADNRLSNLRPSSRSQNQMNAGLNANNTTGFRGVCRSKPNRSRPYFAQIVIDGKGRYLGAANSAEEASNLYHDAARAFLPKG
jgi:hypothetical protein